MNSRRCLWCAWCCTVLFTLLACSIAGPQPLPFSQQLAIGEQYMQIRWLGLLTIPGHSIDGEAVHGLSGLAWDERSGLLYAISDRAVLFHLRPQFTQGQLTAVQVERAYPLRNKQGRTLQTVGNDDSESIALLPQRNKDGTPQFLISFESYRPHAARYDAQGRWLADERLPQFYAQLNRQAKSSYAAANKTFEALAWHPQFGALIGCEWPLKTGPRGYVPLAAKQQLWWYPLGPDTNAALVDMVLLEQGQLLTLERAFSSPFQPYSISLRRSQLSAHGGYLQVKTIARFSSLDDWRLDNFEGLAHHQGQRFFLVSDDNNSPLQSTLLLYLEVTD